MFIFLYLRAGSTNSGLSSDKSTGNYPVTVSLEEKTVPQDEISVLVKLLYRGRYYVGYANYFRTIEITEILYNFDRPVMKSMICDMK